MRRAYSSQFVLFFVLCFFVQTVSAALLPCLHSGKNSDDSVVACHHHAAVVVGKTTDQSMHDCQRCTLDKVFSHVALPDVVRMTSLVTMQYIVSPQLTSLYQNFQPDLPKRPPLSLS